MTAFTIILQAGADAGPVHSSVASLIAQTFTDFELLVLHDGSADALGSMRFSPQDPRITHLTPGAGLSRGECLNVALEVAQGESVVVASAYDHFRPAFLGRIHEALSTSGPHIAAIGSRHAALAPARFSADGYEPFPHPQPDLRFRHPAPHDKPAPNPISNTWSPRRRRPVEAASSKTSGMLAAVVLP